MNKNAIGWSFPPTNGGVASGVNDPGIAHFTGEPMDSLARELIQNSLDARDSAEIPVHVSFEVRDIDLDQIGRDELSRAISSCIEELTEEEQHKDLQILLEVQSCLEEKSVPCLRVSDRNTTGLKGQTWKALVKSQGVSRKYGIEGAGGSHGIGKYAPFVVSRLRTVFYWTCFEEAGVSYEKFQGKSVLISHENEDGKETQGVGFYGVKNDCLELTESIPNEFRVYDTDSNPVPGTNVTVIGYREANDWRSKIARSVITSFFFAISSNRLTAIIEPGDDDDLFELEESTLEDWFRYLEGIGNKESNDSEVCSLEDAHHFWTLSKDDPTSELQDPDLGHCKLWVKTEEGLPSMVGLVRGTGMLITTKQDKLLRFPRFQDFIALCVFEDSHGNELLRQMENPRHDQFEPNRLQDEEQIRGRKALRRITDWIRDEVRKRAGPPEGGKMEVLSELATYLPDYHPEELFESTVPDGEESKSEGGFGQKIAVTLRPIRRRTTSTVIDEGIEEDDNLGGSNYGEKGSGGGGGGTGVEAGVGARKGGTGDKGSRDLKHLIRISALRLLPVEGTDQTYILSFLAHESGEVKLDLYEAGDSYHRVRNDIKASREGQTLDRLSLERNQRKEIEISSGESMAGTALLVQAIRLDIEEAT